MGAVSTCLWFHDNNGHDAARFYVSLIPNSEILAVHRNAPGQPPLATEFSLDGTVYMALDAGPHFKLSEAVSIVLTTKDQAETDRYWEALIADGGRASRCGWLVDRFGVSWQVVPQQWLDISRSDNSAAMTRAYEALMTMGKLDIAALQEAFERDSE